MTSSSKTANKLPPALVGQQLGFEIIKVQDAFLGFRDPYDLKINKGVFYTKFTTAFGKDSRLRVRNGVLEKAVGNRFHSNCVPDRVNSR